MASSPGHATTLVPHPDGWEAEIDTKIAPLVLALWQAGIGSFASCEDRGDGRAWIRMSPPSSNRLIAVVATDLLTTERAGSFEDVVFKLSDAPKLLRRLARQPLGGTAGAN